MAAFNEYSERFLYVIEKLGFSDYKVWNEVESLSKATMSKIRRGLCGVSMNTLCDFITEYPQVNADYIITGRGSMFIQEQESDNSASMLEEAHRNLEDAMAEIKRLKEENELLRTAFTRLQSS